MAKKNIENRLLAVIRIRGRTNVRQSITETLNRLNLKRVNNLVLLYANKSSMGMIKKCESFVTYGEISDEMLSKLVQKKEAKLDESQLAELMHGKKGAKELGLKVPFAMKPPRKGYEPIKKSYSIGGALGYRGEEINELIGRMI